MARNSRREPKASPAQARLLARLWGENKAIGVCEGSTATVVACVKRGWLKFNGTNTKTAAGWPCAEHEVSAAGLLALETFLWETRMIADRSTR